MVSLSNKPSFADGLADWEFLSLAFGHYGHSWAGAVVQWCKIHERWSTIRAKNVVQIASPKPLRTSIYSVFLSFFWVPCGHEGNVRFEARILADEFSRWNLGKLEGQQTNVKHFQVILMLSPCFQRIGNLRRCVDFQNPLKHFWVLNKVFLLLVVSYPTIRCQRDAVGYGWRRRMAKVKTVYQVPLSVDFMPYDGFNMVQYGSIWFYMI